jgi:hypothetical protein
MAWGSAEAGPSPPNALHRAEPLCYDDGVEADACTAAERGDTPCFCLFEDRDSGDCQHDLFCKDFLTASALEIPSSSLVGALAPAVRLPDTNLVMARPDYFGIPTIIKNRYIHVGSNCMPYNGARMTFTEKNSR